MHNKSKKLLITSILSIFSLFTISLTNSLFVSVPDNDLSFNMIGNATSSVNENIVTIYFVEKKYWHTGSPDTYIYCFNSKTSANNGSFPGFPMKEVTYDANYDNGNGRKLRSYEFDTSLYDTMIFTRVNPSFTPGGHFDVNDNHDDMYWGGKTENIPYNSSYNLYATKDGGSLYSGMQVDWLVFNPSEWGL